MTRKETLDAAAKCVCGGRDIDYGVPENHFAAVGTFWSEYLRGKGIGIDMNEITPTDVTMMLALLKIARVASGKPHVDNFVDLAGYAACGAEIATSEQ